MKIKQLKYYLIPAFWLIVTLLMIGQDLLFSSMRSSQVVWADTLIFKIKWLLYIPITFFVFWLGEKLPLQSPYVLRNLLINLFVSLAISFLAVVVYSIIVTFCWNLFIGKVQFQVIFKRNLAVSLFNEFVNYWIILAAHKAYTIFRQFQQAQLDKANLEKQLSDAKLSFLKMQLQPHFLFNTHHNIIGLMQKGDTEKATRMLMKLSDLLRLSLKETNDDLVPLKNEVELLQLYLAILKIRFEERLDYQILINQDLQKAFVPPMLLQPLVENAIKYGIEPFAKQGKIEISAQNGQDKLKLQVKDNGIETFEHFNFGIGLMNTQERLKNLFGEDASLEIMSNTPENGITVTLTLPLLK
ncbi:sensor histidine kinase [Emticicia soli]|uniref:Sensor histidine kinase n=1 Tax=Emticicia soli TaxID=2027878 RepID=A0ABW5J1Q6_9BACT